MKMTTVLETAERASGVNGLTLLLPLRRYLTIVHLVRGRIRLRLSMAGVRTAAPGTFERLQKEVAAAPAIRSFRVNPAALSVTIEFDPDIIPADWWPSLLQADEEEAGRLLAEIALPLSPATTLSVAEASEGSPGAA